MTKERASIFDSEDLDVSGFAPKADREPNPVPAGCGAACKSRPPEGVIGVQESATS